MTTTKNLLGGILAAASLAIALTGCTAAPDDDEDTADDAASATQFAACLTAAGVDAKVGDDGYVLVKQASGNGGEISQSSDAGNGDELILLVGDDTGNTWAAAASSAYFADDPDTQDAYADCEKEFPDFVQPSADPGDDAEMQEQQRQQTEDGLAFAQCARDAGFTWVADPVVEESQSSSIVLPASLTETEFRAVLEACYSPELSLVWTIPDDLGFDWQGVLEELANDAVTSGGEG